MATAWNPDWDMHEVVPRLYLGSLAAAADPEPLQGAQITHVVNCLHADVCALALRNSRGDKDFAASHASRHFLSLDLDDAETQDMLPAFRTAVPWIDEALKQAHARVLVHCVAGASRSATIVAAYLIKVYCMTAHGALKHVALARPQVCPNAGFVRQLCAWEIECRDKRVFTCALQ